MKLVVTIDTEEDNWGDYRSEGYALENIDCVPELQSLFDRYCVRPTYLVTYSVATHARAVKVLKAILDRGGCEIGSHCHPWHTPPVEEELNEKNSMLCNLPAALQSKKLECLHRAIQDSFGVTPTSFRAGRWGYGKVVASSLARLGYRVDTSVMALTDWTNYFGPDFSRVYSDPFCFNPDDLYSHDRTGCLFEVPASVGFAQSNFGLARAIYEVLRQDWIKPLRLIGTLDRIGWLNKIWLSPEQSTASEMIRLAKIFQSNNAPVINMFFHSPTLKPGLTPFVKTAEEKKQFLSKIETFLRFTREEGIVAVGLSEMRGG